MISVIIPTFNEARTIQHFLQALQILRQQGHELILVDGQSNDKTIQLASPFVDQLFSSQKGRAKQQRLGAKKAKGDIFLFLHADTQLPPHAIEDILEKCDNNSAWGRFNVQLSGDSWFFRIIEKMMNKRSCWTGICTGDQAIFVTRLLYKQVKGMPNIALMEDIELSKRLLKYHKPLCLDSIVITSSQRWEKNGILNTILLMWSLRLQYFFGTKPADLLKKYYPKQK